jgi:hypothetical protein
MGHLKRSDLETMSVDDVEVETRFLDAWLEAKEKAKPKPRPPR